jgi:hypothetical protein
MPAPRSFARDGVHSKVRPMSELVILIILVIVTFATQQVRELFRRALSMPENAGLL